MFDKILVPTDGSERAEKAVDHAIEFCRSTGASMTAVYVRSPTPIREVVSPSDYGPGSKEAITLEEIMARMEAHGRELLDAVARRAHSQGVECTTIIKEDDEPYHGIIDVAEQQGSSMIFISSHGRGAIGALLLGSVTQKVLTYSKIPVLVFR